MREGMQSMHYAVGKAGELVCEEILDLNRERSSVSFGEYILLLVTQIRVRCTIFAAFADSFEIVSSTYI